MLSTAELEEAWTMDPKYVSEIDTENEKKQMQAWTKYLNRHGYSLFNNIALS